MERSGTQVSRYGIHLQSRDNFDMRCYDVRVQLGNMTVIQTCCERLPYECITVVSVLKNGLLGPDRSVIARMLWLSASSFNGDIFSI